MKLLKWLLAVLLLCAAAFPQSEPTSGGLPAASAPTRRVKVAPDQAAALVLQKVAVKYPDAARNAGVQGTVELGVVVDESGDVKEVTILSGDPALGQAASEAVKEWKYKPYVVDGSPAEMETQVTLSFHFQTKAVPAPLPLGTFYNDAYFNEYFGLYYPLSRDWVRETQLMRKKLASDSVPQSTYVLLAAVYVPQSASLLDVDSSFTLFALGQPNPDCRRYLEAAAADLQSHKEGQQKGDISQFKLAGRDFYRGNYEHSSGASHRSVVCTAAKDYLLLWNIGGLTKNAVETAVATLNGITAAPPPPTVKAPAPPPSPESSQTPAGRPALPAKVRVSQGVSAGLLIKKVPPVYPPQARYANIQGAVIMQAEINKTGDVVDLEILDGRLELAVSAVNAVRQWKYRPYLLLGQPVTVQTQIVVNYTLSF